MGVWHEDAVVDLNDFRQVVGSNLKHLEFYFNPGDEKVRSSSRFTPAELAICLSFPKLETLNVWNLDFRFREDFVREIKGWETSKVWPNTLREIRLTFRKLYPREFFNQFYMLKGSMFGMGLEEAYAQERSKIWHTVVERFGEKAKLRHKGEAADPNSSRNWKAYYEDEARHCLPPRGREDLKAAF